MKYALACAAALAVTLPRLSYGQDCKSAVLNPCINSDNLWVHPGASRFVAIGATEMTNNDHFALFGKQGTNRIDAHANSVIILYRTVIGEWYVIISAH